MEAAAAGEALLVDVRLARETTDPRTADVAIAKVAFDPAEPAAFVAAMTRTLGGDRAGAAMLICEVGVRSAQARGVLLAAGFTRIGSVDQGYLGWRAAGLALRRTD